MCKRIQNSDRRYNSGIDGVDSGIKGVDSGIKGVDSGIKGVDSGIDGTGSVYRTDSGMFNIAEKDDCSNLKAIRGVSSVSSNDDQISSHPTEDELLGPPPELEQSRNLPRFELNNSTPNGSVGVDLETVVTINVKQPAIVLITEGQAEGSLTAKPIDYIQAAGARFCSEQVIIYRMDVEEREADDNAQMTGTVAVERMDEEEKCTQ
ncbi:unnamed protein product [Rotaria magnacalcarata]|uniref:Uncharacterized protein n=1 Tax=Rotaria magnacalcarata TaxID=392030 RepID=A0A819Z6D4_9BILA|nr:unnamed protein product [Rotaria magnacalcarata]CAF4169287.1 unnamed protein product [Rotaria magnacalcarata]